MWYRYWQSEYDGRVDKEFVVNFDMSRNAKEPRFPKRPSQLKKKPKQVKHRKFSEYHTFVS